MKVAILVFSVFLNYEVFAQRASSVDVEIRQNLQVLSDALRRGNLESLDLRSKAHLNSILQNAVKVVRSSVGGGRLPNPRRPAPGRGGVYCNGIQTGDAIMVNHGAYKWGQVQRLRPDCSAEVSFLFDHQGVHAFSLARAERASLNAGDAHSYAIEQACGFRVGDKFQIQHSGRWKEGRVLAIAESCVARTQLINRDAGIHTFSLLSAYPI